MRFLGSWFTVAMLCLLAFAGVSAASTSSVPVGWVLLEAHIVKGTYPFAMTSSRSIDNPKPLAIRLLGPKGKKLLGSWSAYCKKGVTSEMNHGTFTGTGAAMGVLRFPFSHPDNCVVAGGGRLADPPSIKPNASIIRLQVQMLSHR
jgi:hypothetical protein